MVSPAYLQTVQNQIPPAYRSNRDFVDETLTLAKEAMKQLYHEAVIANGGDEAQAERIQTRYEGDIRDLAVNLSVLRYGEDVEESAEALRGLLRSLENMGYQGGRVGLHEWLGRVLEDTPHNNAVLRAAGFDETRIRRETRTQQDDVQALVELLKEQVELLKQQVLLLQTDPVQGVDPDQAAEAAQVTGAEVVLGTDRTAENPQGEVPAGTLRVGDLDRTLVARI